MNQINLKIGLYRNYDDVGRFNAIQTNDYFGIIYKDENNLYRLSILKNVIRPSKIISLFVLIMIHTKLNNLIDSIYIFTTETFMNHINYLCDERFTDESEDLDMDDLQEGISLNVEFTPNDTFASNNEIYSDSEDNTYRYNQSAEPMDLFHMNVIIYV